MRRLANQKGFTLVEIAIVLVIIGLILGAVLKGQGMIQNSKIKSVIRLADELRAAAYSYQDRYKYLPGDDPQASTKLGGGATNGDGNGNITGGEIGQFFLHLSLAGLISGSYTGTNYPTHAFGDNVYVQWATAQGRTTHWVTYEGMNGSTAQIIDYQIDDGVYTTGSVRGSAAYTSNSITMYIEF